MADRVLLAAVKRVEMAENLFSMKMQEFRSLIQTAGGQVLHEAVQTRVNPDPRYYMGEGKLQEIKQMLNHSAIDLVIFYDELSPSQLRNIEGQLNCAVIDRIQLILDIFSLRAQSKEAKLQVQLAQKEYLLPRLMGQGLALSRLGGGIGTRGPGETKLEQDRRVLRDEISKIKQELIKVEKHRHISRQRRIKNPVFKVGLVGYTNAGKSTILNHLTSADTYEEDQLFATLSPLTRTVEYDNQFQMTLTDTVGFIQDLPPQVIDAFHSTLEESRYMDLLLVIIDASSPYRERELEEVLHLLKELSLDHIPRLHVYNKIDLVLQPQNLIMHDPHLQTSAIQPKSTKHLMTGMAEMMKKQYNYFKVAVAPADFGNWQGSRHIIYFEDEEFSESKNMYILSGYKDSHTPFPTAIQENLTLKT